MPNIVNPAVAVAAQGGGKRYIHNITLIRKNEGSDYVFLYESETATPFTPKAFVQELEARGFTSEEKSIVLLGGNAYAAYADYYINDDARGLYLMESNDSWLGFDWDYAKPDTFSYYTFTDTVREF